MRYGPFFIMVIAFGAAFGWFAPDLARPGLAEAPPVEVAAPGANRVEVVEREGWRSGGEVALSRAGNGHFYAEVSTRSGSVMMLVDTGATVVALTDDDAAMMGVDWNPGEVRPIAKGASGDVHGVPVMLERVQVGDLEARRVRAIVVPEGLDISLLGQSFLSQMKRVEMNGDEMVLGD